MSIDMEFRARVGQALSNTDKLIKKVTQLEERLKKVGRTTRRNAQKQSAFTSGAISQVRQLATAYLGFQAILGGVNKVFGDLEARSLTAARTTLNLAAAEAGFLINATSLAKDEREKILNAIDRISAESGIERRVLFPAAGAAISGSGGLPASQVIEGMEIGAKLASAGDELAIAFTSAIFDVKRAVPSFSIREAAGFLAQTGQFSKITDIGKTGQGLGKSLTTLIRQGISAERVQALFITATLAGSDPEGRIATRATLEFGAKLNLLFKGMPQTTFRERAAFMEENPRAIEKWIELTKGSFAIQMREPFQSIFTVGSFSNTLLKKTIKQIDNAGADTAGRISALHKMLESFAHSDVQKAARLDRTLKGAIEKTVLGQTDVARLGIIRGQGEKLMTQAMGGGALATLELFVSKRLMNVQELRGTPADVIALSFLMRIHAQAVKNNTVTRGLMSAIEQQIRQVSPEELEKARGGSPPVRALQEFMKQHGRGKNGAAGAAMPGGDVEHLLERHRRLFWGGRPQFKPSEFLQVAQELKRFIDTQISKEEIQAASLKQQRELTIALQDLVIFLRRRPQMPANPNTHIENR